jgi:superoxide reductase
MEVFMAVRKVGEEYRCNICSNEVEVTKVGGGVLSCCGLEMEKAKGNKELPVNMPDVDG